MKTMMKFVSCICLLLFVFLQGCTDYGKLCDEEAEKQRALLQEHRRLRGELASVNDELEQVLAKWRDHEAMRRQLKILSKKGVCTFLFVTERNSFILYLMILWSLLACAGCWIVWRIV